MHSTQSIKVFSKKLNIIFELILLRAIYFQRGGDMILDDGISVERKYKQQGNITEARDVLRSILAIDNRQEDTWLLFSKVTESKKDAVYCRSRCKK
jgi:hypothetical protein